MRINTNVSALAAARNLSTVQDAVAKSSEKLSSGFRINHASDDAAGLGVANTLGSDVRAYTQASSNAQQAQSVFNIAEGATTSIVSLLQRMKELAVQSSSDTVDSNARSRANDEYVALYNEMDRTIKTSKFQGNVLLDGTYGKTAGTASATFASVGIYSVSQSATATAGTYTLQSASATQVKLLNATTAQTLTVGLTAGTNNALDFSVFGITVNTDNALAIGDTAQLTATITAGAASGNGTFQVGASGSGANDTITTTASDFDLATSQTAIAATSVTTLANASAAITALDTAITKSSSVLGKIGAYQSRMSSALGNLTTLIQNYAAAESTIRDVDMATEMVKFSKNQVLAQAGTAMLAQANQAGQGIMRLFQ
ncbi:MAG: flagellin N-terminal helical domain-containing protein [Gemmatimonadaceae bacterium]